MISCSRMSMTSEQSEFKNEVKQWLKSHRLDYRWMAERCGVSEITVRNWMSQKNIPPLKQQLIERIMVQAPATGTSGTTCVPGVSVNASMSLTIQLAPEMFRKLTERAQAEGISPEMLVAQAVSRLISDNEKETPLAYIRTRKVDLPDKP